MYNARIAPQVILDPGHGGTTAYGGSSPLGYAAAGGLAEKHVNLELAQRVAARLGPIAQLTRNGDTNLSLRERAQAAARSGARVLVSLHANAGAAGERGSEVWVHERHERSSGELARELEASLDRVGPTRGIFSGPLAVLEPEATGGCAACLVEADYLSDAYGRNRLTDGRGLDQLADAISSGIRTYLGRRGFGTAHGLPNLNFGPTGPNGRPLGAVTINFPVTNMPAQIMWTDYNDSDTMAGSYYDTVTVTDANGFEVFRETIRPDGLDPGASATHSVVWYPRQPGPVTVRVRLNSGEYAIPEDSIDDNISETTATVGVGSNTGAVPMYGYGSSITARAVTAPGAGMNPRYRADQNIGYVPFYGSMRARYDYTNNFVWLVWPHRRNESDPPASVDIDVTFEIFEEDPQVNTSAQPIDTQTTRVQLAEDQKYGFEYSRLTPQQDYFIRITYVDYGQAQDAGMLLWTNGYG
jgi:N-acetylmuramoyl-L-alanine amidase